MKITKWKSEKRPNKWERCQCACVCLCVCEKCVLIIHFKISLVLVSFVHLIFIKKHMVFYGQIVSLLLCRRVLNLFFFPSHSFLFLFILRNLKPKKPQTKSKLVTTENVWSTTDFDEFLYAEILANFTIKMSICAKQM